MKSVTVSAGGKTYKICIGSPLFYRLPELFKEKYSGKKIALISDNNVYSLYGGKFSRELIKVAFEVVSVVFKAGENNKNFATLNQIYSTLADNYFTRSDIIVALGGGVTGDIAGLAAATFLRGMGFIQIPTTLLAMVDSSIGGKTAIDLPQGKNLIGAFYQPDAVYTDPQLLTTLSHAQFADGMAELLKHGFIKNKNLYNVLVCPDIAKLSATQNGLLNIRNLHLDELSNIIKESCIIKRDIIQQDEKDNGLRQLLNFGHTIGHAIERVQNYSGYTHGQAISMGMVMITQLTESMGLTKYGEAKKIAEALKLYGLPVTYPSINTKALIEAVKLDKKARTDKITIAYIEEIGKGMLLNLNINDLKEKINGLIRDYTVQS